MMVANEVINPNRKSFIINNKQICDKISIIFVPVILDSYLFERSTVPITESQWYRCQVSITVVVKYDNSDKNCKQQLVKS